MLTQLLASADTAVSIDGAGVLEAFILPCWRGALGRGSARVVSTKPTQDPGQSERRPDTWMLTNTSPVAVQVESVALAVLNEPRPIGEELEFVDESLHYKRRAHGSWKGVVIPPGESLRAHVPVNHTMTVRSPCGKLGWLERRTIDIRGHPQS